MTVATPSPPPSPPSLPPATGSWLPACTTVNVGSGYDLIAAAAAAPLSAASSSAVPLGDSNYSSSTTSSAEVAAATAAAARKEAILNEMTGAEFLASIGLSLSFSPPPRRLPITNLNETQGGSNNDTVTGAAVCSNDAAYTAGPTASPTVCMFINCYDVNNQRSCFICSGTFVGDPSGAGRLIFLTGKKKMFSVIFSFLWEGAAARSRSPFVLPSLCRRSKMAAAERRENASQKRGGLKNKRINGRGFLPFLSFSHTLTLSPKSKNNKNINSLPLLGRKLKHAPLAG